MAFKCTIVAVLALAALATASIVPRADGNVAPAEQVAFEPTTEEILPADVEEGNLFQGEEVEREIEYSGEEYGQEEFEGVEEDAVAEDDFVDDAERDLESEEDVDFGVEEDETSLGNDEEFDLSEDVDHALAEEDVNGEEDLSEEADSFDMATEVREEDGGDDEDVEENLGEEFEFDTATEDDLEVSAHNEEEVEEVEEGEDDEELVITNVEHFSGDVDGEELGVSEDFAEEAFAEDVIDNDAEVANVVEDVSEE